ncbi:MAG: carbon-nitrogen hydrolase family protein [Vicinamibacterales bacterium]
MDRIRVASLQYYIRPVDRFEAFEEQVVALVDTAADYECQLVVFPEYFSVQLLTLGDLKQPMPAQVRALARYQPQYLSLMSALARKHRLYLCAGTLPIASADGAAVHNQAFFFGPDGTFGVQGKLHMTRFETEEWGVEAESTLRIFETAFGKVAIAICYDVEFPELARAAALAGVHILLVPACTDDRHGFLRVRYCAHARAIENQMYVVVAHTVGSLPMAPAVSLNYGQAAILTPSDFPFSRDGVLAEGNVNQEMMVIGELNLHTILDSRTTGTVIPLDDSRRRARQAIQTEEIRL